jgi:hypothetical protein
MAPIRVAECAPEVLQRPLSGVKEKLRENVRRTGGHFASVGRPPKFIKRLQFICPIAVVC